MNIIKFWVSEKEQWQTNQAKAFTVRRSSQSRLTTPHIISACVSETVSIFNFQEKRKYFWIKDASRHRSGHLPLTVCGRQQTLQVDSKDLFLSQVEQCSWSLEGKRIYQNRPFYCGIHFNKLSQTFVGNFNLAFNCHDDDSTFFYFFTKQWK